MTMRRYARATRQGAVMLLLVLAAGCFHYTQVPLAQANIGRDIRVHLTDSGYTRLQQSAGDQLPQLRKTLEGPLVAANGERLLIAVPVYTDGPTVRQTLQQRLAIPVSDVLGLERKSLDKRKTALIGAGVGAALIAFIAYYVSGEFGGTTGPFPEPGPTEIIQLVFRLAR